jgi:hypothetical protein
MTYRADRSAIEHELEALRQELATLARAASAPVEFEARRIALETEIARIEGRMRGARPEIPLLRQLKVVGPCDQPWSAMQGSESVRRCAVCDQHVYKLEAMTVREIEDMILFTNGAPCTQLRRREDGTIITRECVRAESERRLRRGRALTNVTAVVLTAILAGTAVYYWQSANERAHHKVDGGSSLGVSAL